MDNTHDLTFCEPWIGQRANRLRPLENGEFVVLQTSPSCECYTVGMRSFDYGELKVYCDNQNYMSDYSYHSVFVYDATVEALYEVLHKPHGLVRGKIFDEEWRLL